MFRHGSDRFGGRQGNGNRQGHINGFATWQGHQSFLSAGSGAKVRHAAATATFLGITRDWHWWPTLCSVRGARADLHIKILATTPESHRRSTKKKKQGSERGADY